MDLLVTTEWLAGHLGDPGLKLLDATYFALDPSRDARAEYEAGHIPGALFLDLPSLKDKGNPVPFMLPKPEEFAARMTALGVSNEDRIILYDGTQHRTAARAWWMARLFGARNVALLDGGLQKWVAEGRPLTTTVPDAGTGHFVPAFAAEAVRSMEQVRENLTTQAEQLVDARGAARFSGAEQDPRPEVAPGHIPGSRNLPYDRLFNPDGSWKRDATLRAEFAAAGVDLDRPLLTTCGSGVTAAVLLFGAALLGKQDVALYDGSWSEWGTHPDTPKETGAA